MKKPICACTTCQNEGMVKLDSFRRGGRSIYLCSFHAENLESYSFENELTYGTDKVNPWTFGQELETSFSTLKARVEIIQNGYVPTSDATVNVEYKSPIFQGLNAISKQSVTIERLINSGEMGIGLNCGTHTHVGHKTMINAETMGYIRRFYHSLFLPLSNEMRQNPELVEKLFGRGFGEWCMPISEYTDATAHTNFVNTQHTYSLEFRIVKFVNAAQYMQAVKFCRDVANAVVANFLEHFNDANIDSRRYPTMTDYRKHKASIAAQKMVKLFHKYAEADF